MSRTIANFLELTSRTVLHARRARAQEQADPTVRDFDIHRFLVCLKPDGGVAARWLFGLYPSNVCAKSFLVHP